MIKAEDFFKQHEDKAGECVYAPTVEARRVQEGDSVIINVGFNVQTTAEEDGWQVFVGRTPKFVNDEEFAAQFTKLNLQGTQELPEGATADPVLKGQEIYVQPWDDTELGVIANAESAGWVVTLPENGKPRFMSDAEFRATYKTDAAPLADDGQQGVFQYVPQQGDPSHRFVVLREDTTFDFDEGAYTAPAGYVLYENEDDVDGYTVVPGDHFKENYTVTKAPEAPQNDAKRSGPKGNRFTR